MLKFITNMISKQQRHLSILIFLTKNYIFYVKRNQKRAYLVARRRRHQLTPKPLMFLRLRRSPTPNSNPTMPISPPPQPQLEPEAPPTPPEAKARTAPIAAMTMLPQDSDSYVAPPAAPPLYTESSTKRPSSGSIFLGFDGPFSWVRQTRLPR